MVIYVYVEVRNSLRMWMYHFDSHTTNVRKLLHYDYMEHVKCYDGDGA